MRQRHQYRILQVSFVFALIGVAFFGAYQGGDPPTHAVPITSQNGAAYVVKEKESLLDKALDPISIITLILVVVTWRMAISVNEQVRLAREEFVAGYPPELVMREVSWEAGDNAILFTLVNRGRNPCTIVESNFIFQTGPSNGRALPTQNINRLGRVKLAAGEFHTYKRELASDGEFFSAGARGLTTACYFRSTIIYVDDEGVRRRFVISRECVAGSDHFVSTNKDDEYTD